MQALRSVRLSVVPKVIRRRAAPVGLAQLVRFNGGVAFQHHDLFETTGSLGHPYKKLTSDHVSTFEVHGKRVVKVDPQALTLLTRQALIDVSHLLRPGHLQQLSNILQDPEASSNDRFVALELLKNANIAAAMILPGECRSEVHARPQMTAA